MLVGAEVSGDVAPAGALPRQVDARGRCCCCDCGEEVGKRCDGGAITTRTGLPVAPVDVRLSLLLEAPAAGKGESTDAALKRVSRREEVRGVNAEGG